MSSSFPRKRESSKKNSWMPACAGMTIFLSLIAFLPNFASALVSDQITTDQASVRFLTGNQNAGEINLGLEFKIKPGWKVYWRTPGDAGMPITLDWSGSKNLKAEKILWPAPVRSVDSDLETFGYYDYVLLPVTAKVENPGQPVVIDLKVTYAICKDICLTPEHEFHLVIPADAVDNQAQNLISQAIALVPGDSAEISIQESSVKKSGEAVELILKASAAQGFHKPDLIVEGPADFRFPQGSVKFSADRKQAIFTVPVQSQISDKPFTNGNLIVTLVDGKYSTEKKISAGLVKQKKILNSGQFGIIIIFAFLGGLILNLMPCVLPVLSIKLLGVLKQGGKSRHEVRQAFLSSTAGILFSFLLLAAIISLFKQAGMAVGWGFHFQEPVFVIFLILVLLLFSANLFGLFEINLPRWLDNFINHGQHEENEKISHFMSGALAALLATPCSAPLLGSAISFALSQGITEIFVIFYFIGAGLAAPYIVFAFFPGLVTKLPKPGRWMLVVKYLMGLFLVLTICWLIWILSAQLGKDSAVAVGVSSILFYMLYFITKWWGGKARYFIRLVAIFVVAATAAYFLFFPNVTQHIEKESGFWQEFKEDRISQEVAAGNVVLVDVTASWCLTCKANEIRVFGKDDVKEDLLKKKVVALRADWTNRNPAIRDYLAGHNRFGIPFNAVYGPHAPRGIVLSELVSRRELMQAIDKAR